MYLAWPHVRHVLVREGVERFLDDTTEPVGVGAGSGTVVGAGCGGGGGGAGRWLALDCVLGRSMFCNILINETLP